MTIEEAVHVAMHDGNYHNRIAFFLASACRNIAGESAGARQQRAAEILLAMEQHLPKFGLQLLSLLTELQIAALNSQSEIPVGINELASVYDAFLVKDNGGLL